MGVIKHLLLAMNRLFFAMFAATALLQTGCRPGSHDARTSSHSNIQSSNGLNLIQPAAFDPCSLALAPHSGATKVDQEIIRLQQAIPTSAGPAPLLERLGWMFITKARASFDPGFYKLAEQCAACLDSKKPGSLDAMLLRGHVLQNLHRFKEAEPLARELVTRRGSPFDHGLLGDVLMEQGKLDAAIRSYQTMVDLKPDPQAYARLAHVRWLRGDLPGALEVMRLAASAATPQAAESSAWLNARMAFYELQEGDLEAARRSCEAACAFQKDYAPALLILGRILLADGKDAEAVEPLLRAARMNPLPEYQWTLAEAWLASGMKAAATEIEAQLVKAGAIDDPRTYALFLATRGQQPEVAIALAEHELSERADVHTHDALAWALAAAGRWAEAHAHSKKALAEGTDDARIHLHAGIIAAKAGFSKEAGRHLARARELQRMLLPSERQHLDKQLTELASLLPETAMNSEQVAP